MCLKIVLYEWFIYFRQISETMAELDYCAPPEISVSFAYREPERNKLIQRKLFEPLISYEERSVINNITFICYNSEKISWNGLAYIGSLSVLFKPRSGEEQRFTVMVPDYRAELVRKLLLLISAGSIDVQREEITEIEALVKDLRVRIIKS